MVLVLPTLSDGVLYLYQDLSKYLISYGFRVADLNSRVDARVDINVDGWTTDRKPDPYIAPCLRKA